MPPSSLILFALTEFALCLTPGPAVLLVVSQGLMGGTRRSTWSALGILSGNLFYFVLSATGLGAVLITSYKTFRLLRWIGAAYLIWLGISLLRGKAGEPRAETAAVMSASKGRLFRDGFVLQIANPKAILFFTALLPQFVDPKLPLARQVIIMALASFLIELVVLTVYGYLAGRIGGYRAAPRFVRLTNRLAGSMFVLAGLNIASRRQV